MRLSCTVLALALLSSPALASSHHSTDWARPDQWCGWFLRKVEHVSTEAANSALWWARNFGRPAHGPAIGRIVVWNHGRGRGHVGKIVGHTRAGWIVLSGNDGHRVRRRVRNVANAYAFREAR